MKLQHGGEKIAHLRIDEDRGKVELGAFDLEKRVFDEIQYMK